MAADVMMGHDPDCARWIRRFREAPPLRPQAAPPPRPRARHAAAARAGTAAAPQALHERAGRTRRLHAVRQARSLPASARRCCRRRAASGVDVDSVCGGRALCGRCQVLVMEGDFPKHGVSSHAANLSPVSAAEQSFSRRRPLPAGHRLSCSATHPGRPGRRRAARQPGASPGGAQGRRRAPDHARPGRASALRRGARAGHARPVGRSAATARGAAQRVGVRTAALRPGGAAEPAGGAAQGRTGRSPSRCTPARRSSASGRDFTIGSTGLRWTWARPPSPPTCAISKAARWSPPAASMNPQIRFGEDLMSRVSYSMMHPGGAQQMTEAVRAALNTLAAEVAREAKVSRVGHSRADHGRQPDHASPAARHRSGGTRRRAVCARDRFRARPARRRARTHTASGCARLHAAVHRRSRGRGCRRHDPRGAS